MSRFKIEVLGCKVNSYEGDLIRQQFLDRGFSESDEPDVIVINSCCVTAVAEAKSRQRIRKLRRENPNSIIVVVGCLAQLQPDNMGDLPADLFIGNGAKGGVVAAVEEYCATHRRQIICPTLPDIFQETPPLRGGKRTRGYVKIADGCNNACSYCLVWRLRGPFRSRLIEDIIVEIEAIGDREVVLCGIDTGSYGSDIGGSMVGLLKQILERTEVERIRISSIENGQVDQALVTLIATNPRIAPHLHLPLQSGSDTILRAMNRHYLRKEFIDKAKWIKSLGISLTCDIIVGYPGESERDFKDTLEAVEEIGFLKVHAFCYSPRPDTPAALLPQVADTIKESRLQRLLEVAASVSLREKRKFIGRQVEVLIEEVIDGVGYGYSGEYLRLQVKGAKANQVVKVVVEGVAGEVCVGRLAMVRS